MNPKYHLLVAVAALSLSACSTDDICVEPEIGGHKISFTVAEDPESRTTLDRGDYLWWVPTDQVGIYTVGNNVNPNTFTVADVNQHPVEFIGTLKKMVSPGDMFYAYYPYDEAQSTDPSSVKLTIPAAQTQTEAGVYNGESHPLVALPMAFPWERESYACRMSSVRFRQLGAIVEMQLYSSDEAFRSEKIQSVKFVSDAPLAGNFTFDLTGVAVDKEPQISGYELKEAMTTLDQPAVIPATKDEAALVYLTIAPGTYTGQIVVKTDIAQYTFGLTKAMTFERAVIKGLPADLAGAERKVLSPDDPVSENDPIHFEDLVVEGICLEHWDTDGNGELSYKEAAAVQSIELQFQISQKTYIRSFNELQYFTGLQSIGNYGAFSGCSRLTNIHLPNGLRSIGEYAFRDCSSLTSINIPDEVISIGDYAFNGCSSLTNITIPDGVTSIGDSTFSGCSSLASINIPDGVTSIRQYAFSGCSSLTNITIPEGVAAINRYTFSGCSSLKSLNIPQSVSSIGECAFLGCCSLSSFNGKYASADNRCLVQYGTVLAFAPAGLTKYTIPDRVVEIGNYVFCECSSLKSIHIPDGVFEIGIATFRDCSSLTSINIPDEVTSIEQYAFSGCSSLTSINLPDGVTSIEYGAFYDCSSLTSINIPDGVTGVGEVAFSGCSSLMSITIPDEVTSIGQWAFNRCSSLTSVYCKPTTPPSLGNYAFYNTPSSMQIYVPAASVEAYKTAGNWGGYASQIFADNN